MQKRSGIVNVDIWLRFLQTVKVKRSGCLYSLSDFDFTGHSLA